MRKREREETAAAAEVTTTANMSEICLRTCDFFDFFYLDDSEGKTSFDETSPRKTLGCGCGCGGCGGCGGGDGGDGGDGDGCGSKQWVT